MTRLAAYTDDPFVRAGGTIGAVMPFALFLAALGDGEGDVILAGRVRDGEPAPVALPPGVEVLALPWWDDLARPLGLLRALPGSAVAFWRLLDRVDTVLLFGPSPIGILFALLTRTRRRRLALGVRMDYVRYVEHRRPGRRGLARVARALDAAWRLLARGVPTVVVGAELAQRYGASRAVLPINVSLVRAEDVEEVPRGTPGAGGPIEVLTVGRVDEEKNPLLLPEVIERLVREDGRDWRLTVCGDGPLLADLQRRCEELGVADRVRLRGFVPPSGGLRDLYRGADMFLHVSWTEGMPQVLLEAWATGLPVVATEVGGVGAAVGADGGLLVAPGDAGAAVAALRRLAGDDGVRARVVAGGLARAREHTLEREAARVTAFVGGRDGVAAGAC
jgi:glycosyltransferase involved in cell wall biosynthesis